MKTHSFSNPFLYIVLFIPTVYQILSKSQKFFLLCHQLYDKYSYMNQHTTEEIVYETSHTPDPSEPPSTLPSLNTEGQGENTWQSHMANSIKSSHDLRIYLSSKGLSLPPDIETVEQTFPLAITHYYASLIKNFNYSDPVFKMCVPDIKELNNPPCLSNDPLNEEHSTVVEGLVHRYPDRALLISTSTCAMFCRFCTRKRVTSDSNYYLSDTALTGIVNYLSQHPEIKDVIISGGDPFTMSTNRLEKILKAVRSVPTVDIIRIGTRTPVVLPSRITTELVTMLSHYHPIFVNTHFNHPNEITPESTQAVQKLINCGIPVNNQTVLLEGVNDNPTTISTLCRNLLKIRVRPYYLFICDLVKGVEHFRTSIQKGLDIMEYLRGRVSGLGIPTLILDSPEGKGKIPLLPNYSLEGHNNFRNYKNEAVYYPDPT